MLHRKLIRLICNTYNVGNDAADIIQNYVLNLCCSALIIKAELHDYISRFVEIYDKGHFYYNSIGFLIISTYHRYRCIARNIIGSFFNIRGKENMIDYYRQPTSDLIDDAIRRRLRIIEFRHEFVNF